MKKILCIFLQFIFLCSFTNCTINTTKQSSQDTFKESEYNDNPSSNIDSNQIQETVSFNFSEPIYQYCYQNSFLIIINSESLIHFDLSANKVVKRLPLPYKGIQDESNRYHLCSDKNEAYFDMEVKEGEVSKVVCIDLDTAAVKFIIQNSYCERYKFYDKYIYQQVDPGSETLVCFDRESGKILWSHFMGVDLSPIFEINNTCYAFRINKVDEAIDYAEIYIINPSNGKLLNRQKIAYTDENNPYPQLNVQTYNSSIILSGSINDKENFFSFQCTGQDVIKKWGEHFAEILDYQIDQQFLFALIRDGDQHALVKIDLSNGNLLKKVCLDTSSFKPYRVEFKSQSGYVFITMYSDSEPIKTKIIQFSNNDLVKQWENELNGFEDLWIFQNLFIISQIDKQKNRYQLTFYDLQSSSKIGTWENENSDNNEKKIDYIFANHFLRVTQYNENEILLIFWTGRFYSLSIPRD